MCGIAGIVRLYSVGEISMELLKGMIAMVHHRGPDGYGYFHDERVGLAHARLSIIDLEGGWQPIYNEDKTIAIVFNGEIFNYLELREVLVKKGHRFSTHSDTEVIVHLYEEYGTDCLSHLNGQFAFALWDKRFNRLLIARDRVGIRPLFYTHVNGALLFASEIKSLFADRRVTRELDPAALDQIFTFWMTIPPRTAFKDIYELPAGHFLVIEKGEVKQNKYWDLDFTPDSLMRTEERYADELRELLIDSTRLQLRADVPVGAYLSGGIDSSVITTLIKQYTDTPLRTFSVTFHDESYDESEYQHQMIEYLQTDHSDIKCGYDDISRIFPDVVWHTEKPIVRTAPAPLFLLAKLVRESGYKVVLTGEGSDEILGGYDIFKEVKVRRFMERYPDSTLRPLILKKLYPYLANSPVKSLHYAKVFFSADQGVYPEQYYSHVPRWTTTSKIKSFYSAGMQDLLAGRHAADDLSAYLSRDDSWDDLSRAQHIEIKTLLSGYLLSSQGDRMAMANSIEARFPFLDHRVIEFCCKLPASMKLKTLTEKYLLKRSMKNLLPSSIINRTKQPYMAPDAKCFIQQGTPEYVNDLMSEKALRMSGYFNPKAVIALLKKCRQSPLFGFKDNMAFVGILSTQLIYEQYIRKFSSILQKNTSFRQEIDDHAVQTRH
jgi:asparagine synthase (glutamine-hydrolysing)